MKSLIKGGVIILALSFFNISFSNSDTRNPLLAKLTKKEYEQYLKQREETKKLYLKKGDEAIKNSKYDEAILYYQKALNINPEDENIKKKLLKAKKAYFEFLSTSTTAKKEKLKKELSKIEQEKAKKESSIKEIKKETRKEATSVSQKVSSKAKKTTTSQQKVAVSKKPTRVNSSTTSQPKVVISTPKKVKLPKVSKKEIEKEKKFNEYFSKAEAFFDEKKYPKAIENYALAKKYAPQEKIKILDDKIRLCRKKQKEMEISKLVKLADKYEREKKYDEAIKVYLKIRKLDSNSYWDKKIKELNYAKIKEENERKKEVKKSTKLVKVQKKEHERIVSGAPIKKSEVNETSKISESEKYYSEALNLYKKESYDKALKEVEKAIEINPKNVKAVVLKDKILKSMQLEKLLKKGYINLQKNNIYGAKNVAKEALAIQPDNPKVKKFLMDIREKEKQIRESKKLERVKKLVSEAQMLFEEKKYKEAKQMLLQATNIKSDYPPIKDLLLKIKAKEKELKIANLKKELVVYINSGDYENAIKTADEILALTPSDPDAKAWKNVARKKIEEAKIKKEQLAKQALKEQISRLLKEAKEAYRKGDVELAHLKWQKVLKLDPSNEEAKIYLKDTQKEYEAYLSKKAQIQKQKEAKLEAEKKLYTPITITFTDIKLADFLNQLSLLSNINFVIAGGADATISGRFSNTPLIDVLNTVLIPNGLKYEIKGDKVIVSPNLISKTFNLTEQQTAQLKELEDRQVIAELLYGPTKEPKVKGQKYIFDPRKQLLIVIDSESNIKKIETLIKNLPSNIVPKLETKMYTLKKGVGEKVKLLLQALLDAEATFQEKQLKGRQVIFDDSTNTLIVRDTPKNIKLAEKFLSDREFIDKIQSDQLMIKVFPVVDKKLLEADPVKAKELERKTVELIKTLLYHKTGESQAKKMGRQIWLNEDFGTITILDTASNIERVADFLINSPWKGEEEITEIVYIDYVDPGELASKLEEILGFGGGAGAGATGGGVNKIVRRVRPDTGFKFRDCDIQCIRIRDVGGSSSSSKDNRPDTDYDAEVTLLISTPTSPARTVTLKERESVEQIGDYMIRIPDASPNGKGWADVEVQYTPQIRNKLQEEEQQAAEKKAESPISITPDMKASALILRSKDPTLISKVKYWISKLDVPVPQVTIETKYVTIAENAMKTLRSEINVTNFGNKSFTLDEATGSIRFAGINGSLNSVLASASLASSSAIDMINGLTTFSLRTKGLPVTWQLQMLEAKGIARVVNGPIITAMNNETSSFLITKDFRAIERMSYTDISYEDRSIDMVNFSITPVVTKNKIINLQIDITMTGYEPGSPELDNSGATDEDRLFDVSKLTPTPVRDEENERQIQTKVHLKDGETIVLGGFKAEAYKQSVSKVPVLGDIPFIGRVLFSSQKKQRQKNDLLIFLTAYLLE